MPAAAGPARAPATIRGESAPPRHQRAPVLVEASTAIG